MEETVLFSYKDGDSFYEITCDEYSSDTFWHTKDYDEKNAFEKRNMVETGFDYSMAGYGWGAGNFSPVYTYDIKNMYEQLTLLKAGKIDILHCTFECPLMDNGYYIEAIIDRNVNHQYEALFAILDDLDCVEFGKFFSEEELDEQIKNLKNCMNRFPVR